MGRGGLACVTAVMLGACATPAPPAALDAALTEANSANLIVYRPKTSFHSANPELPFLYVNGQQVGKLAVGGALEVRLPVGEHALSMKEPVLFMPAFESHKRALKADPGKTYYVRYSREAGGVVSTAGGVQFTQVTGFDLVPEEVGKQRR